MEPVLEQIVRQTQNRYYGKYRGQVTDNEDPEARGRLRVRVPSVLADTETDWAMPCLPFGGAQGYGLFLVPEPGAEVWIEFEEGDISRPLWSGVLFGAAPGEEMTGPKKRVLRTPGGHVLALDDTEDAPRIELRHSGGAVVAIDDKGSIAVTDQNGAAVTLDADGSKISVADANGNGIDMAAEGTTISDANGNAVEMRASGVTVKAQTATVEATQVALGGAGGEPVLKGSSFLSAYMAHVHPTGVGPSGPPIPTTESMALSMKVTTA